MRRALACLILVWFAAGCGSGSNNDNAFAGSWSGKWSDSTTTDSGTFALVIDNKGYVAGTAVNSTTSTNGAITGTINAGGLLNVTIAYSTTPTMESGYVVFGPTGAMVGNLTETQSGAVVGTAVISLTRQ